MSVQDVDSKEMSEAPDNQLMDRVRRLFGDVPLGRQVAALPWRAVAAGAEIMMVTSRDTGRWVLPKGWVEKGEKLWRAAEREAHEEAGVRGDISHEPAGRYFYAKVQKIGRAKPCEVIVYPLTITGLDDDWKEKGKRERRWFAPEEAAGLVDEEDLAELIRRFGQDPARAA